MSIRSFLRKLVGHAGRASRSKLGASSHIHTKRNKRAASKAYRRCEYGYTTDRTFFEDHHLDIPDEITQKAFRDALVDPRDPHGYDAMPNVLPPCSAHSQQKE